MKVSLVSSSQPSAELVAQGIVNAQELVAYCARVSNPANQTNTDTSEKLIRYLIKHRHWSPLEMVSACLEIETTRDIARQILRHRSFSFQEFSQRYAVADLGWELKETRLQDTKNRQNSIALSGLTLKEQNLMEQWKVKQQQLIQDAEHAYDWAIANGIAKEQARAVLPEGLTVSRLYMQGTLRSWLHYIELRSQDPETQKEHRQVADSLCWCIGIYLSDGHRIPCKITAVLL
jgi:thymidylate synthase (FAD)